MKKKKKQKKTWSSQSGREFLIYIRMINYRCLNYHYLIKVSPFNKWTKKYIRILQENSALLNSM